MPTYEYKCFACDHTFERFQSITAEPIKKCPECGKNKVRRLMGTGAGLIFKGSGFYITDYRSESYKSGAKSDSSTGSTTDSSSPPSAAGASSSGAPESKPAAPAAKPAPAKGSSSKKKQHG